MFIVLVLFVGLYAVLSTAIIRQLEDERFTYRENFVWAVFQIQRQYFIIQRDIEAAFGRSRLDQDALEEVMLEYEILVSRVFLLRDGEGFRVLLSVPEVAASLEVLQRRIEEIDRAVAAANGPRSKLEELYRLLDPMDEPLQQAVVRTTNFVSVYNAENIRTVKWHIELLTYLFFVGVVAMAVLGGFMIRQRQRVFAADIAAQKARQEQEVIEEAADYAKMHALGTLAGGVAHEINTPAQYIQNNLEFLSDSFSGLVDAVRRQQLDPSAKIDFDQDKIDFLVQEVPLAIDESIQGLERIAEIVRGIRKFAHPANDAIELISITEEIDTAVTLTRNQVKHVADLEVDIRSNVTDVNGRRNHLSQALINLIVNASQAIRETDQRRGRIELSVTSDDDNVYIRLRDNGSGVPEELRDRIFDYFFTTKERGVGTGQGLPICRKLIQDDFGGDLTLSSDYIDGAEFVIRLPIANPSYSTQPVNGAMQGPGDLNALLR
ncbi:MULTISPECIES: sensor histidine kinase [Thalassospira]|uniref:histidine kinase n=2 Tax=Thalassospira TaxID=168934 RepID=A0A367WDG3_9PROT|nr:MULTISPECIES: ATP-binding protein [Thalassospira]MDG4718502.1 ATP-binding protein [Thalassospira sp. FZY0004]RCK39495.1 histidine kinase [Thalassospira profundimaris]